MRGFGEEIRRTVISNKNALNYKYMEQKVLENKKNVNKNKIISS